MFKKTVDATVVIVLIEPPEVSVCVVTYNHVDYIKDCLMSVLDQCGDSSIEILVGDDQSDDGTSELIAKLVEKFPKLIRHFRHNKRLGFGSKNYQALLKNARGKYIAHLDGDDYWLPGKLRSQIDFLDQNEGCMAVYTNALILENRRFVGRFNNPQQELFSYKFLLKFGNFLNHSSILYRASLKQEILAFHTPFLDYKIHLSFSCHGSLGYINQFLTVYRIESTSSTLKNQNNRIRELYWKTICEFLEQETDKKTILLAKTNFLTGVFFRALNIKCSTLFFFWWDKVSKTENRFVFALVFLLVISRKVMQIIYSKFYSYFVGALKVSYWR